MESRGESSGQGSCENNFKMEFVPNSDLDDSENETELVMDIHLDKELLLDIDQESIDDIDEEIVSNENENQNITNLENDDYNLINDTDLNCSLDHLGQDTQEHDDGAESNSDVENNDGDTLSIDVDNLLYDDRTGDEMFKILTCDPEWFDTNYAPIHVRQFIGPTGFNLPEYFDTQIAKPIDYFQFFFSDEVLQTICDNTNKYQKFRVAQKQIINNQYQEKHWEETALNEMRAYFGLAIMFGITNQPRYRTFWSKDPFLGNAAVQRVFSLKRYCKLSEYLHVTDRENEKPRGHPEYDKLGKICWLIDHLLKKFPEYKFPEKNQTVDEQIMKFSGCVEFLQYNIQKPVRHGLKLWVQCDADSAYCQEFEVYLEAGSSAHSKNGALFDVVWKIVKSIQGKNHCVYFDNYYSSVALARFLYSKQIYSCATIQKGRKLLPEKIKHPGKLVRGKSICFQSTRLSNLTVTVWQDTKDVRFLSTLNKPGTITKCSRRVGHRRVEVNMPSAAFSYSKNYSAVDRYDRLCSKKVYGSLGHGSNKVWKHLLWHMCNLAIGNAWILYQKCSKRKDPKSYDHLSFRHELATQLIGGYSS